MIIEQRTAIRASCGAVFGFFERMRENYLAWHPDHIVFRWLGTPGVVVGGRFHIEERINGQELRRDFSFVRIERERLIAFSPVNPLIRFFLPEVSFAMEPAEGGCLVVQRVRVRIGPIGRRLNQRGFAAVQQHMMEEGENMKALLESPGPAG